MSATKITFNTPTTYSDGTPIAAPELAALTYSVQIDTVNPPAKAFPVPAANLAAGTANADGSKTVTVHFTDIGFTPSPNVVYYADVDDSLGALTSADSPAVHFTNVVAPNPPSALSVG